MTAKLREMDPVGVFSRAFVTRRAWAVVAALGLWLGAGELGAADRLVLVEDGEAKSVIVVSGDPSAAAKAGAKILADHLRQISGASLETLDEDDLEDDDARVRILVGESERAAALGVTADGLGPGGIAIRTFAESGAIVILGPTSWRRSIPMVRATR